MRKRPGKRRGTDADTGRRCISCRWKGTRRGFVVFWQARRSSYWTYKFGKEAIIIECFFTSRALTFHILYGTSSFFYVNFLFPHFIFPFIAHTQGSPCHIHCIFLFFVWIFFINARLEVIFSAKIVKLIFLSSHIHVPKLNFTIHNLFFPAAGRRHQKSNLPACPSYIKGLPFHDTQPVFPDIGRSPASSNYFLTCRRHVSSRTIS